MMKSNLPFHAPDRSTLSRSKAGTTLSGWCLLLTALLVSCNDHTNATAPDIGTAQGKSKTQQVVINGLKFDLELALTPRQRQRGLSDRPSISETGGMLFVFPKETEVGFVMRKCLVPIDIIFAKEDGTVAAMYEMEVEDYDTDDGDLKTYPSHQPVLFALEFKAGTLAKLGIKRGDKINLPAADLKSRAK